MTNTLSPGDGQRRIRALTLNHINEDGGQAIRSPITPFSAHFINAFCHIPVMLEATTGGAKDLQIGLVARHPLKTLGDWSTFRLKQHADSADL